MTVSTIASVASSAIERSLGTKNSSSIAQSIGSLISASTPAQTITPDLAQLSLAVSLQSQVSGLRAASLNIAQTSSMVDAADDGASNISRILGRLQDLATRASADDIDANTRRSLDVEFQAIRSEINRAVATISFNGRLLLDGSVKASDLGLEGADDDAGLPDLSQSALFGDSSLSIGTQEDAQAALQSLQKAQTYVTSEQTDLASFQSALEIGGATVESAMQNKDASNSTLSDSDLDAAIASGSSSQIENNAALSLLAQTNRLPANLVQLLAE